MLALALLGGCDRQSSPDAQQGAATSAAAEQPSGGFDRSHRGSKAPDLTFTDLSGTKVSLSTPGKPLLVNLWATWCAPCVAELPTLDGLAGAKGDSLRVLAVSQDMGTGKTALTRVKAFWDRKGFTHLHPVLDPEGHAAGAYQAATLPTTIYYDAQGREVWRLVGGHDWSSPDTARLLAETGG